MSGSLLFTFLWGYSMRTKSQGSTPIVVTSSLYKQQQTISYRLSSGRKWFALLGAGWVRQHSSQLLKNGRTSLLWRKRWKLLLPWPVGRQLLSAGYSQKWGQDLDFTLWPHTGSQGSDPDRQLAFQDVLERVMGNRRALLALERPDCDWRETGPQVVSLGWRQGSTMASLPSPEGALGATSFQKKVPEIVLAG